MAKRHSTINSQRAYMARQQNLARLGFSSYRQYLASDTWSQIRERVLATGECWCCGSRPSSVHHSSYPLTALAGNDDSVLYAVCHPCHKWAHKGDGSDPMVATTKMRRVRSERMGMDASAPTGKLPKRMWKKLGGDMARLSAQSLIETSRLGGDLRSQWLDALAKNP